jgi:26S proteasome regulatory subunit T3
MANVAVESPANIVPPHKRHLPSSIPNVDSLEEVASETTDDYSVFKRLQRQLEYIQLQEEYIKDEQRCELAECSSTCMPSRM